MSDSDSRLTAIISVVRHGQKDEIGELTEKGKQQAIERAQNINHLKGDIISIHSGVNRVKDTIFNIGNSLRSNHQPETQRDILDYQSRLLHFIYDSKNQGEFFGSWESKGGDIDKNNQRAAEYLKFGDTSPEPDIFPSPKDTARRVARLILTEIDFASITIPELRTNFVNGTHEPVILAFLYYFLQDFQPTNENFVSDIGGTIEYAEGFEFLLFQEDENNYHLKFKFRDISKDVDLKKFKQFVRGN